MSEKKKKLIFKITSVLYKKNHVWFLLIIKRGEKSPKEPLSRPSIHFSSDKSRGRSSGNRANLISRVLRLNRGEDFLRWRFESGGNKGCAEARGGWINRGRMFLLHPSAAFVRPPIAFQREPKG